MTRQVHSDAEYYCPGDSAPISRAVHLGRLSRYYEGCRSCPRRHETASLPRRRVKRLGGVKPRMATSTLFATEALEGTYLNDLEPATAARLGRALGVYLSGRSHPPGERPLAVIAGDGRPAAAEMLAAAGEGLRWSGAEVVKIGSATAPCLAFAIRHLAASGGILAGNQPGRVETVGLKFWTDEPCSKSDGGQYEEIGRIFEDLPARPWRQSGRLTRYRAEIAYLEQLSHLYHALRPLRFVLDAECPPAAKYVRQLLGSTACEFLPRRAKPDKLGERVAEEDVHFGVRIDQDGERPLLWDERGRTVGAERLLVCLAEYLLNNAAGETVVLEEGTSDETIRRLESLGYGIVRGDARRAEMHGLLKRNGAVMGGGPSGRFWYRTDGPPAAFGPDQLMSSASPNVHTPAESDDPHYTCDALLTLSHLLGVLSRSDRPLSAVLDGAAPVA